MLITATSACDITVLCPTANRSEENFVYPTVFDHN